MTSPTRLTFDSIIPSYRPLRYLVNSGGALDTGALLRGGSILVTPDDCHNGLQRGALDIAPLQIRNVVTHKVTGPTPILPPILSKVLVPHLH